MIFERQIHKTNFTNTISKITQKSNVRSRTLNVEPRWSDHQKKNIPPKSGLVIARAIDFLGRCFWRSFFQTQFVKFVFCSSSFEFPKSTLHIWCLRFERTLKIHFRWVEFNFWSRFLNSILQAPVAIFNLLSSAFRELVIDIDLWMLMFEISVSNLSYQFSKSKFWIRCLCFWI